MLCSIHESSNVCLSSPCYIDNQNAYNISSIICINSVPEKLTYLQCQPLKDSLCTSKMGIRQYLLRDDDHCVVCVYEVFQSVLRTSLMFQSSYPVLFIAKLHSYTPGPWPTS